MLPKDLLVVDLETTGMSPYRNDPIQIGAVLMDKVTLEEKARFMTYIAPDRFVTGDLTTYSPYALIVTGFSPENIEELKRTAPSQDKIIPMMEEALFGKFEKNPKKSFTSRVLIAGQNVDFDLGFIKHLLKRAGLSQNRYGHHKLDTTALCILSQSVFGMSIPRGSINLDAQLKYFGLSRSAKTHDALEDALLTAEVLRNYLRVFSAMKEAGVGRNFFTEHLENGELGF